MPLVLLGVAGYWLVLAVNALKPRYRPPFLAAVSFFPAWLLTERLPLRLVLQVAGVALLAGFGALEDWRGWTGLGLCLTAWGLMGISLHHSLGARRLTEHTLRADLGGDGSGTLAAPLERLRWPHVWIPWPLRPRDVAKRRTVPYRQVDGVSLGMDIIRGRDTPPGAPFLMFIHGGGWVIGHKDKQGLPLMYHLAQRGWICCAPSYRLAPRGSLPQMVEDCKDAVRWIREHAEELGGDPSFLALYGGSAGGHLASLLALTAGDERLQPGFEEADTRIQACVSFYGIYDLLDEERLWPNGGMARLLERHVLKHPLASHRALYESLSPLHRIHAEAPPFCLLHGTLDNLAPVAGARLFAVRLRAVSRAPVVYVEYPRAHHAFEVFPSLRCMAGVHGAARFLDTVRASCAG